MTKETILSLLSEIKAAEKKTEGKLPQNSFYLDYDKVVCLPRSRGESRFPYDGDGLMVWLHSTGFINAIESNFNIFKTANCGEESAVSFFCGIKNTENGYTPVSVTGASRAAEEKGVSRYILYTLKCAYCFVEVQGIVLALRLHVDEKKHIHFSLNAINVSDEKKEFYIASFMEAILRYAENEGFWSRLTKYGKHYRNGSFILKSRNGKSHDSLVINSKVCEGVPTKKYHTCSRSDFLGESGLSIANSRSLRVGGFDTQAEDVATTDLPIAADMFHFTADAQECVRIEYELCINHSADVNEAEGLIDADIDIQRIDRGLELIEQKEKGDFDKLNIRFKDWNSGKISADTFNKFLRSVQKQVTICAHGKNYAGSMIGVRDVFQQIEAALIWQGYISREKILIAMDKILVTGRPPRQYSIPATSEANIYLNVKKYIDQGVWIINTVYTYLAYTGDYSILDEECGYLEISESVLHGEAKRSTARDSVLCHLKKIMDYMLSQIDYEYGTGCLRALFGDWNDALDGLGRTEDKEKEYGSGVTIMATLQLYQNLREMTELLCIVGDDERLCKKYAIASQKIEKGLEKYAIDVNDNGERRIIHGWGDKLGYKVGSFNDPDRSARYSLTANSFWAISKFLKRDPSLKSSIMDCMNAVSSKYGLRTFDVPFPENTKGVGRISSLVPGTYENCCVYVHGALFGTMALFEMGESQRAWEEIEKAIVITHDNCTMTSFIMPNSYCENPDYGMDGESMGDWHTGSATVLIKEIIRYGFGICPTLNGVLIQTPKYFPSKNAEITLRVRGSKLTMKYSNNGQGKRTTDIIGADEIEKSYDDLMGINTYFIPFNKMSEEIIITTSD